MYNVQEIEENINLCGDFNGGFLQDEPMADKTTFKVGGFAKVFVEPYDVISLQKFISISKKMDLPFIVIGGGSNIVVADEGITCPVVSTRGLKKIFVNENNHLVCESGCTMESIVSYCLEHSLAGLERFAGLPGTIGGALYMNARCYDISISDVVDSITYLDKNGELQVYHFDTNDWDYKKSPFQEKFESCTIISAELVVNTVSVDLTKLKSEADFYIKDRENKGHFRYPSAGSVFKNNRAFGKPSGKIIDECGLKGYSIGGAQVAPWHGNLIINTGNATAKDIKDLTFYVAEHVYEQTGYKLEPEIIFLSSC